MTFGALLRHYRRAAGLSQAALAGRAGLSRDAIRALERGRNAAPQAATLARLVAALGLAPAESAALVATTTAAALPLDASAARAGARSGAVLPHPPTPLIGREHAEAALVHLLHAEGARLLTLTGPGGVGKTRLALAVAAAVQNDYRDGVAFIDLAALRDPRLVLPTVAQALGVRDVGVPTLQALIPYLGPRHLLLVLDNLEQVVEAAPQLADLVARCPDLAVLATSRTALRVRAERRYPVPPLDTPAPDDSLEEMTCSAAVRLFVARARAVQPAWRPTAGDTEAVAAICRRLDGLPLALELAAARSHVLPPAALLQRLERLQAEKADLGADLRELPARQQTLRATIAWSYALLTPGEQELFRRLAVFAGGCTPEAAEAVCSPDGSRDVLVGMAALVDHSLLRHSDGAGVGEPRLTMLETLREDALERLVESGEDGALRRAHALYYLALAEEAAPELVGPQQARWLARLEREHDNLRAALRWAMEEGALEQGLRLAVALWWFWQVRGYIGEGRAWLERLLATDARGGARVGADTRMQALRAAGWLAHYQYDLERAAALFTQARAVGAAHGRDTNASNLLVTSALAARAKGDYRQATTLLEESLAWLRARGDRGSISRQGLGLTLARLGMMVCEQGDYTRATALWEECLALHRALADREGIAIALLGLSDIARDRGNAEQVRVLCAESMTIFEELGERWGVGFALNNLALAAHRQGDHDRAAALAAESVALFRRLGAGSSLAEVLSTQGCVAGARRDVAAARATLAESLRLARREGPRWLVAADLEGFALIAANDGQAARAARFLGAAAALREAMGAPLPPAARPAHGSVLASARAALGPDQLAAAYGGGAREPEQVVDDALGADWATRLDPAATTPRILIGGSGARRRPE